MTSAWITLHAIDRYRERIEDVPVVEVVRRLDTPALRCALTIGARAVKLGSGHRLVLRDGQVVTVTPAGGDWI